MSECAKGNHEYINIIAEYVPFIKRQFCQYQVLWCKKCGSVRVSFSHVEEIQSDEKLPPFVIRTQECELSASVYPEPVKDWFESEKTEEQQNQSPEKMPTESER